VKEKGDQNHRRNHRSPPQRVRAWQTPAGTMPRTKTAPGEPMDARRGGFDACSIRHVVRSARIPIPQSAIMRRRHPPFADRLFQMGKSVDLRVFGCGDRHEKANLQKPACALVVVVRRPPPRRLPNPSGFFGDMWHPSLPGPSRWHRVHPVTNRARSNGTTTTEAGRRLRTNPILKAQLSEIVKKHGELSQAASSIRVRPTNVGPSPCRSFTRILRSS